MGAPCEAHPFEAGKFRCRPRVSFACRLSPNTLRSPRRWVALRTSTVGVPSKPPRRWVSLRSPLRSPPSRWVSLRSPPRSPLHGGCPFEALSSVGVPSKPFRWVSLRSPLRWVSLRSPLRSPFEALPSRWVSLRSPRFEAPAAVGVPSKPPGTAIPVSELPRGRGRVATATAGTSSWTASPRRIRTPWWRAMTS